MFDIGFWEILLILVLALVVIGPERLPGAARKVGYLIGKGRRYIEGVRSEVESELDVSEFKRMLHNQEVQINELKQQLQEGADEIGKTTSGSSSADFLTDVESHSFYDTEPKSGSDDEPSSSVTSDTVDESGSPKEQVSDKTASGKSSQDQPASGGSEQDEPSAGKS